MNETMCSHQIGDFLFYKRHNASSSGSQPCLSQCAAAHLADAHGTPMCRGTPVENHCIKLTNLIAFNLLYKIYINYPGIICIYASANVQRNA